MARKDYIENWLGKIVSVEIMRDDYSCRKTFNLREESDEASRYFEYLQSLDNQEISIQKQTEIAKHLQRQNELAEQQLALQTRIIQQQEPGKQYYSTAPSYPKFNYYDYFYPDFEESKRLKELGRDIDNGTMSVDAEIDSVRRIVLYDLYVFKEESIILRIAELGFCDHLSFPIFLEHYGDVPGVISKCIQGLSFYRFARRDTVRKVAESILDDKELVCAFFTRWPELVSATVTSWWEKDHKETLEICQNTWSECAYEIVTKCDLITLKLLISKQLIPDSLIDVVQRRIFGLENEKRIANGVINDQRDLSYAENHFYSFTEKCYNLLLALAEKSTNGSLLLSIEYYARELSREQTNEVYYALLNNPYHDHKEAFLKAIIKNSNTESELLMIKPYLYDFRESNLPMICWLERMQELGFIGRWGRRREFNKILKYRARKNRRGGH